MISTGYSQVKRGDASLSAGSSVFGNGGQIKIFSGYSASGSSGKIVIQSRDGLART